MDINSIGRFVQAQEHTYQAALKELRDGQKRSHWMWYIFPQLRGLGTSSMAHIYGISGIDEAKSYLKHPILSRRLYDLCDILLTHQDKNVLDIFGDIDAMKLKSSMTLFALASHDGSIFHKVLDRFFDGEMDGETLQLSNQKCS